MNRKQSTKNQEKPKVNDELSGFEISINEFGEIRSTMGIQKLNSFLDKHVDDKKFRGVDVQRQVDANLQQPATEGASPADPLNRHTGW